LNSPSSVMLINLKILQKLLHKKLNNLEKTQ